jgi:paraquat-inducible protein A
LDEHACVANGTPRRPRLETIALTTIYLASAATLPVGLLMPILLIDRPLRELVYGVITGIWAMLTGGLPLLALLVFCFSVVFPLLKLVMLGRVCFAANAPSTASVERLRLLGKWSMLDVYIVVILMGAIRLGVLADIEPRPGIYVFGGSVLLAMAATILARRGREAMIEITAAGRAELVRPWSRALSLAATAAFATGLCLPLMEVEKWVFWSNDYSILRSLGAMAGERNYGLLVLVVVFVLLLPTARLLGFAVLRWHPAPSARMVRGVLELEDWAMADVFALALLVVVTKASRLASISLRLGLWFLVASAALMMTDAWLMRRSVRASPSAES